jgi:hypothetical protein
VRRRCRDHPGRKKAQTLERLSSPKHVATHPAPDHTESKENKTHEAAIDHCSLQAWLVFGGTKSKRTSHRNGPKTLQKVSAFGLKRKVHLQSFFTDHIPEVMVRNWYHKHPKLIEFQAPMLHTTCM